jgi:hypothetical protein
MDVQYCHILLESYAYNAAKVGVRGTRPPTHPPITGTTALLARCAVSEQVEYARLPSL